MYKDLAKVLKALSDENRLEIIHMLRKEELCACELEEGLDLSQSGLSYHMKILYDNGLVLKRPKGNWIYYRLNDESQEVFDLLESLLEKYKIKVT